MTTITDVFCIHCNGNIHQGHNVECNSFQIRRAYKVITNPTDGPLTPHVLISRACKFTAHESSDRFPEAREKIASIVAEALYHALQERDLLNVNSEKEEVG